MYMPFHPYHVTSSDTKTKSCLVQPQSPINVNPCSGCRLGLANFTHGSIKPTHFSTYAIVYSEEKCLGSFVNIVHLIRCRKRIKLGS
jgi:hypothetical protein